MHSFAFESLILTFLSHHVLSGENYQVQKTLKFLVCMHN